MHVLRISIVSAILLGSIVMAPLAFADNDNDKSKGKNDDRKSWVFNFPFAAIGTTTASLAEQIKALQEMLANLKAEREALSDDDEDDDNDSANASSTNIARETLRAEMKQTRQELKFARSLMRGMSGDDVRDLQELLAQDPAIFSSAFITGFFGPITEEALRKFQRKHGIEAIGIFGPKTQAKILALFVGRELPPGIIKRLGLETSTTTPGSGIITICHIPPGNTGNKQTLVIAVSALGAHLAHGDSVGVCAGSGTSTTTPPAADTTAPIISAIAVSGLSSTTATVSWTTNEAATGKIYYGTTTPVNFGSALTMSTAAVTTGHTFTLVGLTASTTHYYAVESKDAANNTATSSTLSFTTQL